MKAFCIKDHACSSINDFCERIRPFELKKKMMMNTAFYNFLRITVHVAVYFTYFESIIVHRSTWQGMLLSEKA